MNITVCNGKGGVGKTTVSVLLALAYSNVGKRVFIQDIDPQGSAAKWVDALELHNVVTRPDPSADITITDTPPNPDSSRVRDVVRTCDRVLLVSSPSPADLWTTKATVETVLADKAAKKKARILFNRVQSRTILGKNITNLAAQIGLPAMENCLGFRQGYQQATVEGWKALSPVAREEVLAVALEIL